jgi:hypothetical protein
MLLSILGLLLNYDTFQYPTFLESKYKDGDYPPIVSQSNPARIANRQKSLLSLYRIIVSLGYRFTELSLHRPKVFIEPG